MLDEGASRFESTGEFDGDHRPAAAHLGTDQPARIGIGEPGVVDPGDLGARPETTSELTCGVLSCAHPHGQRPQPTMEEIGAEPIGGSPEQMARQIRDDTDRFARLVKDAKVALD